MAKFKLKPEDIALLREWGETDNDCIKQVERVASEKWTKYELIDDDKQIRKKISREEAIEILGREKWLSGIHRSAFHCSACCYQSCERSLYVLFDSYDYFK